MGKTRVLILLALATCFIGANAFASKNDFELWRMCQRDTSQSEDLSGWCIAMPGNDFQVQPDQKKFKVFARQLTAALAPKYHAAADTLGWSGWNLGIEFTVNDIPGGDQWNDALEGVERFAARRVGIDKENKAPNLYNTVQFHARKGLPYSLELGFIMTYILNSEMFMTGIEGKFSLLEGFRDHEILKYFPDVALRFNYSHLFGSNDLDFDIVGGDISVSKIFGLGGMVQLTPYVGYSLVYSIAAPKVMNPTFDVNYNSRLLILKKATQIVHRGFFGLRLIAYYVSFTPEIIVTGEKVTSYSFNLGADF